MKYSEEYRDQHLVRQLIRRLHTVKTGPATIMEVCGTHTMSVARFGLKMLLPDGINLISGPGCPVCVTDQHDLDGYLALGMQPGVVLATFGDMVRVPGSHTSLDQRRAVGTDVRVIYSPFDAVEIARLEPDKQIIFFGVGFETTMPATALAILTAAEANLENFTVYCVHKTMPAALQALLSRGETQISGLLLPGHVSAVTGSAVFDFIPATFRLPCAVTGFEPLDILLGVESILSQLRRGRPHVANVYQRAVSRPANPKAQAVIQEVFLASDSYWRGLGLIPGSGISLQPRFRHFDAKYRFARILAAVPPPLPTPCHCGEVLRGFLRPLQCPLFGDSCTPSHPIGPCMVSSEGACAAAYRFG
ncbi:hydrogenase formation protein HypD [Desulfobacca acetoxidans]|uniref:Hydrogenase expression/formation protein HypD n=1 Tax=Desulfobacca acetoxidans (strain ATCC 700848 / DSM 11109 / ASRB2) TaxID=880072 RepID=F2NE67_DESAR|nr:hydrogenase formation protein HypD [Desulfobacca acetoxidans]AEB10697.1 hydrogenase expression/formation protein HypD [Desulfobacca acetoxidans DSM 11109]